MLKIEFDLDLDVDEFAQGIQRDLNSAVAATAGMVQAQARIMAAQKLKSGLKHWNKGFSVDRVDDGTWMISMTGKLANMMEDGFKAGAIKDMILNGNRAKFNKAQGKNYVDVPIPKDADAVTGQIKGTTVTVQQFKSADDVIRSVSFSDWQKGGVNKQNRIIKRVNDIIESRKPKDNSAPSYMVIRRVSPKSKGWPVSPFSGARIFEALDQYLETAFEKNLESFL